MVDVHHFGLFEIRVLTITVQKVNVCHLAKFHRYWSNHCKDMAIKRFSKWRWFRLQRVNVRHLAEFHRGWSNRPWDMAPSWIFKNSNFQLQIRFNKRVSMCYHANFLAISHAVAIDKICFKKVQHWKAFLFTHARSWNETAESIKIKFRRFTPLVDIVIG